jgi:hypothetical protein
MTSEQPSPNEQPLPDAPGGQPDIRGAVPADGQPAPADRERTRSTHMDDAPAAPEAVDNADDEAPYRDVTVRRAPKFVPFMAIGAVLGFIAAFVVAYTGPEDPTLTRESILGFFTISFALPGLLLGALVVLVVDRRSVRRAERARAERTFDDER